MQRRAEGVKRERISVSLDAADYEYVQSISGGSDSHRVAKIIQAARLAGLKVDDQAGPQIAEEFVEWLSTKKRNKAASDLHKLLTDFLEER
jgi:molybdenum cofactor biosynthesis enzyme MoaA